MMNDDPISSNPARLDRRKFILGGALLGTAALGYARTPTKAENFLGNAKLEDVIPKRFGQWSFMTASGLVTAPEDQLSRKLYAQLMTRVYTADNQAPVMMLVAQSPSQTGVLQVHRPEVCYPASGYTLSPVVEHDVAAGPVTLRTNLLSASSDGRTEHIIYWTRIGRHLPVSWAEQRWAVARDNLDGILPDAVLARVSVIHPDRNAAVTLIEDFTRSLLASLAPAGRRVLLGTAAA